MNWHSVRLLLLALYLTSNLAMLLYEVEARWQSTLCKRCQVFPSCFGFFQVGEGFWLVCFLVNSPLHIKLILYSFPLFSPKNKTIQKHLFVSRLTPNKLWLVLLFELHFDSLWTSGEMAWCWHGSCYCVSYCLRNVHI